MCSCSWSWQTIWVWRRRNSRVCVRGSHPRGTSHTPTRTWTAHVHNNRCSMTSPADTLHARSSRPLLSVGQYFVTASSLPFDSSFSYIRKFSLLNYKLPRFVNEYPATGLSVCVSDALHCTLCCDFADCRPGYSRNLHRSLNACKPIKEVMNAVV